VPYSPGPQDGPDPVTLVLTKSRIRIQTVESGWTLAGAAVWAVGWLGLSPWLLFGAGGLPDPPSWIPMTFAATGIAGVLLWGVGAIPPPGPASVGDPAYQRGPHRDNLDRRRFSQLNSIGIQRGVVS